MPVATTSDDEFIELWNSIGSATELARILGLDTRTVFARRTRLQKKYQINLLTKNIQNYNKKTSN